MSIAHGGQRVLRRRDTRRQGNELAPAGAPTIAARAVPALLSGRSLRTRIPVPRR